jgi:hypothetical protein
VHNKVALAVRKSGGDRRRRARDKLYQMNNLPRHAQFEPLRKSGGRTNSSENTLAVIIPGAHALTELSQARYYAKELSANFTDK